MRPRHLFPFVMLLLTLIVSSSQPTFAQAAAKVCNDPKGQLQAALGRDYPNESLVVLAFDHKRQTWAGYRWRNGSLDDLVDEAELKVPFTNKPRVFLKKEEMQKLAVFIVNTDPLLFSTKLTGVTETSIEDLANLQKLAGLLGGFLSAGIASRAPQFEPPPAPPTDAALMARASIDVATAVDNMKAPTDASLTGLYNDAKAIATELKAPGSSIKDALKKLDVPRSTFETGLRQLKVVTSEIKSYLQLVENDSLSGTGSRDFASLSETASSLDSAAEQIAVERNTLDGIKPVCVGALTALRNAVRLFRSPLPDHLADQRVAIDEFKGNLEDLEDLTGCTVPGLALPIDRVRLYLKVGHDEGRGRPSRLGSPKPEDDILRPLFEGMNGYLTLVDQQKSALKAADDLLAASNDAVKIAEAAQSFRARHQKSLIGNDPCSLRTGVIRVPRNPELAGKLSWTKFGTENLQLVADSPFKDAVVASHPVDVSASYEIQRAWHWDLDVDVGPIYTDIVEPVYTSVEVLNTATPDVADDKIKLIRKTDEKRRAGELAMFLSLQYRSRKPTRSLFSIGPQLGAGLNTDHPSLFAGFGLGLGRYLKLGGGYSWQRVKELADPQKENRPVEEGGAIRLRDGLDDGYYAFVSITIDELPFFKAP